MKKKALIVVNLAGFLHFLWNDIATLQEMGYEVSVAMNENSAAGPNLIEIPKLEEMGIAHYQVEFDTKSPVSTQNIQASIGSIGAAPAVEGTNDILPGT